MSESITYRNALPLSSMLLEYRLESVLGAGGFGMTYLGWDTHLEKHVAIKEYLPGELAVRALDGSVVPVNTEHEYNYKWGLDRFIQEARTLAKFSHPNIVRVNRFFETNGTGYMVMDYEAGESLHQHLKRSPMPDEAALKNILLPVIDGLQAVHQAGFLHRDIKPSNVFIRENGTPVLLDFGSARMAGTTSQSMTAIVSPGYAPLEQYAKDGHQGPWSDIYALAGVMYRAITGENPPDAVSRMRTDAVPHGLTAARTRYSERFLKAVEWGLTIDEKMRPQSVAEWREVFLGRVSMTALNRGPASLSTTAVPTTQRASQPAPPVTKVPAARRTTDSGEATGGGIRWGWWIGAVLVALALAALLSRRPESFTALPPEAPLAVPAASPPAVPETPLVALPSAAPDPSATSSAPLVAPDATVPAVPESVIIDVPATAAADSRSRLTTMFRAADTDGSGHLDPAEAARKMPVVAGKFEVLDTNHDGRLTLSEIDTAGRKDFGGRLNDDTGITQPGVPFGVKREFVAADRDGDGYLAPDELQEKLPRFARNLAEFDTDGDRRISLDEFWKMRKKTLGPRPSAP